MDHYSKDVVNSECDFIYQKNIMKRTKNKRIAQMYLFLTQSTYLETRKLWAIYNFYTNINKVF